MFIGHIYGRRSRGGGREDTSPRIPASARSTRGHINAFFGAPNSPTIRLSLPFINCYRLSAYVSFSYETLDFMFIIGRCYGIKVSIHDAKKWPLEKFNTGEGKQKSGKTRL